PAAPDPPAYALVDRMLATGSQLPDEVPLAVLYWTSVGGVQFIDRWAVRRRIAHPDAGGWPFLSDRRTAEAEAMLYQFHDHLADLVAAKPDEVVLRDHFRYLPPAGVVPVGLGAFDLAAFFDDLALHPTPPSVDASLVRPLLLESLRHEPIRVDPKPDPKVKGKTRLQLYRVYDDLRPFDQRRPTDGFVLFAAETMPYSGVARFDDARWNRSRFGPEAT
ncbi:MAG TPA: hypothetical protein VKE74_00120, partial [Gemmataceae bacterium]|nr:hypothetical protein [Gemmataceae bacterium]